MPDADGRDVPRRPRNVVVTASREDLCRRLEAGAAVLRALAEEGVRPDLAAATSSRTPSGEAPGEEPG